MRSIDVHAHLVPACLLQSLHRGQPWHGVAVSRDAQDRLVYGLGDRKQPLSPRNSWGVQQRLADMDSLGVDVHGNLIRRLHR